MILSEYLNYKELWFSFEKRTKLIVELFVDGFGGNDPTVGCKDVTISTVREDNHDHHVTSQVFLLLGKVSDFAIELGLDQVLLNLDLEAEV